MSPGASSHPREEVEHALKEYVEIGLVQEDFVRWSKLFTDDAMYIDHYWGIFRGPDEIARWNDTVCAGTPQTFAVPMHYLIDGDRVVMRGEIFADNPDPAQDPFSMPLVQCLEYGGDGKWSSEEDFWLVEHARAFGRKYEAARLEHDPDHPKKLTRFAWQLTRIPWARPPRDHQVKPSWFGLDDIVPVRSRDDLSIGERLPNPPPAAVE